MAMNRERNDQKNSEFNDKVVAIKRVSKTVKGGRTMRFSALVVVGDGKGRVGVGLGKAGEVPEAIRKGKEAAVKNVVSIAIDENKSIPHDFIGRFGSASVLLKRAPEGNGIIAGGPVRAVVELAGIQNIRTKSLGSNNKTNVVLATLAGLTAIRTPEEIAKRRGKSVEEILG
ncbi:small subunit ribosomal protein S5 [Fusobacterium naviforme]|uniref:Small ribosomal subunit protein uS5 n=2 Tax=Moryella indoligenes TaxID=371674 RepID=A0AAE4AKI2_9FIRM|nr:small subunit ribosomal protein S5 [Moryella indoligenes]PSL09906.1 small subunit ribosomal protein S5 [Fusobacterium naviforme]STO27870.1 30S ribosomal protein S5 [Fusobacterium naviforme]